MKMRNGGTAKAKTCRGGVEVCVWGGGNVKESSTSERRRKSHDERRGGIA